MKRMVCIVAGLMVFSVCAAAQAPTAGQKVGLATSLQNAYATLKGNLTQAAEKMPEANYGFKPAPDPDLRTYGQWIGHQADNQFTNCATIKGMPSPSPAQSNEKKVDQGRIGQSTGRRVRVLRRCDVGADRPERAAADQAGRGRNRARRGGLGSALARPRVVWHRRRLHARQGHRATGCRPGGGPRWTGRPQGAVSAAQEPIQSTWQWCGERASHGTGGRANHETTTRIARRSSGGPRPPAVSESSTR